jgi:hypothetical protein
MMKYNWNIDQEERNRILKLHESATKNHYLIKEQSADQGQGFFWDICGGTVFSEGGSYFFVESPEGGFKSLDDLKKLPSYQIPKLSEISGQESRGGFQWSKLTQDAINLGNNLRQNSTCRTATPMQSKVSTLIAPNWIIYFDDMGTKLVTPTGGGRQKKELINTPRFGIIAYDGGLGAGGSVNDFLETVKKGPIFYAKSRTKNFVIEISPGIEGQKVREVETPAPQKEKPELPKLNLDAPFKFNETELNPDAEQEFQKFLKELQTKFTNQSFIVNIKTSSSIDGDPNQTFNSKYGNAITRSDHDKKLSEDRANVIANRIKALNMKNIVVRGIEGIGQTDQFDKGKKWPEVKDPKLTYKNRKLIVNVIPLQTP